MIFFLGCVCKISPDSLLNMGEKLQSQKTYSCSFSDCKSTFGESWKLEAHMCKHTGLVSGSEVLQFKNEHKKIFKHIDSQMNSYINFFFFFKSQKPFSCGNCDERFCTQHQLTRHELSEEKPIMKNHVSNTQELQKKHFNV